MLVEEKNSMLQASYYMDPVYMRPVGEPVVTYGLIATRMLDAPQTPQLVDIESALTNRFDIIGKCGNVYRKDDSTEGMQSVPTNDEGIHHAPPSLRNGVEIDTFLQRYSDRDARMLQAMERPQWNRDDVNTRDAPYIPQATYTDTRAMAKASIKQ